jgi:hypothetical protein
MQPHQHLLQPRHALLRCMLLTLSSKSALLRRNSLLLSRQSLLVSRKKMPLSLSSPLLLLLNRVQKDITGRSSFGSGMATVGPGLQRMRHWSGGQEMEPCMQGSAKQCMA